MDVFYLHLCLGSAGYRKESKSEATPFNSPSTEGFKIFYGSDTALNNSTSKKESWLWEGFNSRSRWLGLSGLVLSLSQNHGTADQIIHLQELSKQPDETSQE
jgi:hypothetical protein